MKQFQTKAFKALRILANRIRRHRLVRLLAPLSEEISAARFQRARELVEGEKFAGQLRTLDVNLEQLAGALAIVEGASDTVIVRPTNILGYVTHYHHFFGAIVLPILEWCAMGAIQPGRKILVRDCGPMNTELEQWAKIAGFEVAFVPPELVGAFVASQKVPVWEAPCYDHSFREDWLPRADVLDQIRGYVFGRLGLPDPPQTDSRPHIVLVGRDKPDAFYKSARADRSTAGSERRSIPNLEEIAGALSGISDRVETVLLERMKVAEKIRLFHSVDVVIGQMGAGLNNIFWMKTGSGVVEIIPAGMIDSCYAVFGNIAARVGVRHRRIVQSSDHAPVSEELVNVAVSALVHTLQTGERSRG